MFAADCLRIAWYDRFGDFVRGIERGMAKRPPWCPRWLLALVLWDIQSAQHARPHGEQVIALIPWLELGGIVGRPA